MFLFNKTQTPQQRLIAHLRSSITDERVLKAMLQVERDKFVPKESAHLAYEDIPLPIGNGQTISQPYIVAMMTQALDLKGTEKVLEIGTGSGYQAAILSLLAKEVVSIERQKALADGASKKLPELGFNNVKVHLSESNLGWPQGAPYDAILVTAGAPKVPQSLINQLADGGRLVIPVGTLYEQDLIKITRIDDGLTFTRMTSCRFVPLIGQGAWKQEDEEHWDA